MAPKLTLASERIRTMSDFEQKTAQPFLPMSVTFSYLQGGFESIHIETIILN